MRKVFLTFVVVIISITNIFAQSTLVATLTHGTDITMYYGTTALQSAHNAATSGDVINLSGGSFLAANITKGIVIRGTGIDDAFPTVITNNFKIVISEDDENSFSMEGVSCSGTMTLGGSFEKPIFIKSKFKEIRHESSSSIKKISFVNCKITDGYFSYGSNSLLFANCFISFASNGTISNTSSASFSNCTINFSDAYSSGHKGSITYVNNCQFINSILTGSHFSFDNNKKSKLPTTCSGLNCIAVNFTNPFADGQGAFVDCQTNLTFDSVFKTYTGTYADTQTFELTDEAKAAYLGIDGKEVGIYGGDYPYTSTPSYPQITKMDVSKKASADGKLNVEIEVNAAE